MIKSKCICTLGQSLTGDGCRYCQPQEYIDRLEEWLDEERKDLEQAEARAAELEACACDDEMICKYHGERTRDGQAWLLRKQAEAVSDFGQPFDRMHRMVDSRAVHEDAEDYAQRLRQQADEAENG